jgi:hypothetical protein
MTVSAEHLDAVVAYITEHGEQRYSAICAGMRQQYPVVNLRRYLFKKLRDEGRVEKVGYDSYRIASQVTEGSGNVFADIGLPDAEELLAKAMAGTTEPSSALEPTDHLDTPEAIAEYIVAVFEDGSADIITIGDVAVAMTHLIDKRKVAS